MYMTKVTKVAGNVLHPIFLKTCLNLHVNSIFVISDTATSLTKTHSVGLQSFFTIIANILFICNVYFLGCFGLFYSFLGDRPFEKHYIHHDAMQCQMTKN